MTEPIYSPTPTADNSSEGVTTPKLSQIPGNSPNKMNMNKRKGAKPRTQNQPRGTKQPMDYSWADPIQGIPPIDPLDLTPSQVNIPAATIELQPDLPSQISAPFSSVFESLGLRTIQSAQSVEDGSTKLESLSYYKSARQLYASMTDTDKSKCQPLKAIFYDTTNIPVHMAAAISMIGI
jgi:hypothetical protein